MFRHKRRPELDVLYDSREAIHGGKSSAPALSAARHEDEEIRRKEQERGKKKKKRREANEGREMIKEEEEDESKKVEVTSPRTDVIKKRALRRSTSRKRPTIQEQLDELDDMTAPIPSSGGVKTQTHTTIGHEVTRQRGKAKDDDDEPKKEKKKKGKGKKHSTIVSGSGRIVLSDQACDKMMNLSNMLKEVQAAANEQSEQIDDFETVLSHVEDCTDNLRKLCGTCMMIWKISNFRSKFDASKEDKKILYSPAFVTHPHGYNLAMSLCAYGDGKGRGTYMSVFFCILRGESDILLQWPFGAALTFTLMDQSDETEVKDIAAYFEPHPVKENMPFLGRPSSLRNPSLGLPRFVSLKDLWSGRYVKDDAIYIKVEADIYNLPEL